MDSCDVLVVGGGPAGSTCAERLKQAGVDVLLLDKEVFPRQKPCAGWITPAVLEKLRIDAEKYRHGRVLQEIRSFRTGLIGATGLVTHYGITVSYGIRRYEFDHYLLQRSGVRSVQGEPVTTLERVEDSWIVNGRIRARMLVGAGGHCCPVARQLGAKIGREEVVIARVAEYAMSPEEGRRCRIPSDTPGLFFCRDMKGYGWLFRKGSYLNIGLGHRDAGSFARHTKEFCAFIEQQEGIPTGLSGRLQGHAYRLFGGEGRRRCVGDGALLIGDAAGVANPVSGEGILPSIESALFAAETILAANRDYGYDSLEPYAVRLNRHFGCGNPRISSLQVFPGITCSLGARLLSSSWFTRHILLDRWFLRC